MAATLIASGLWHKLPRISDGPSDTRPDRLCVLHCQLWSSALSRLLTVKRCICLKVVGNECAS